MAHVRASRPGDADSLFANLSQARRAALAAMDGCDAAEVLPAAQAHSRDCCLSIIDDDAGVVGMFGIVPFEPRPGSGSVWLAPSDRLFERHNLIFLQECPRWIDHMLQRHEVAFNLVSEHEAPEIRWLKWCGFEFIRPYEHYGPTGATHWLFAKARSPEARLRHHDLFTEGLFPVDEAAGG